MVKMCSFGSCPGRKFVRRGFSLIELLVVLSIIALLAGILFPVFARARERARMSSCQSNLKLIGAAIAMYIADYDGHYGYTVGPVNLCSWADPYEGYAKGYGIFNCPSWKIDYYGGVCSGHPGGYAMVDLRSTDLRMHESDFTHPVETVVVLDGDGFFINPALNSTYLGESVPTNHFKVRHQGGDDLLFVDGHVKWLPVSRMTNRSLWVTGGAA